ncbi:Ribosomal protein L36e like protein [Aduncisulcus paluster]|uniref:Ribosomal protein L36e like protein n=1 Tax=Aduncisulcus paluster TaxID=2918883 RepID=A0ABQ5KQD4_9EUKA|nr:Ribosomal protein L36e like protein [Aduncisulcus paluster]
MTVEKSHRKQRSKATARRNKMVKSVCREVAGMCNYERRIAEMIKLGKDRRALRFAKKRLGNHKRAQLKRDEVAELIKAGYH